MNTKQLYIGAAGSVQRNTAYEKTDCSVSSQSIAPETPTINNAIGKAYIQPLFRLLLNTRAGPIPQIRAAIMPMVIIITPAMRSDPPSSVSMLHLVVRSKMKNAKMLSTA